VAGQLMVNYTRIDIESNEQGSGVYNLPANSNIMLANAYNTNAYFI
jgi:hypothetical protein